MRTLARRTAALVAGSAALAAACVPVAVASPPVPLVSKLSDLARAQITAGATTMAPPETDSVVATYTFAPGAASGWRTAPGTSVFAVTKGALTLRGAKGCTSREVKAGQAAVVAPGRYMVVNAGSEPLEFAGAFLGLPKGTAKPLVDGAGGSAPSGCPSAPAAPGAAAGEHARGTMVPISEFGVSVPKPGEANRIVAEETKDVLVASYEFQPNFSTGWVTHLPALVIVTRGTMTYYEGQAGQCVIAAEYTAGQAYTHPGRLHLATNEGPEIVDMTVVYFNLPHGGAGGVVPVLGNTLDANDFTPLPPRDCPSLS